MTIAHVFLGKFKRHIKFIPFHFIPIKSKHLLRIVLKLDQCLIPDIPKIWHNFLLLLINFTKICCIVTKISLQVPMAQNSAAAEKSNKSFGPPEN